MTSDAVSVPEQIEMSGELSPEQAAVVAMVVQSREQVPELPVRTNLLKRFTRNVLETALNEEMTEHLGHELNRANPVRESTNIRMALARER